MLKSVVAVLARQEGGMRSARVCLSCARRGLLLVAERVAPIAVASTEKSERDALAPFVRAVTARIRMVQKAHEQAPFPAKASAHEQEKHDARVEALEGVLHMLKEGRA
jgi:hypothetical protein